MPTKNADRVRYVETSGVRLAYETFGKNGAPAVLLIHGLATQMLAWPVLLCEAIASQGYRVIRFDNRDIGLSTILDKLGEPSIRWLMLSRWLGLRPRSPYTLGDMAGDALELMDGLGIATAHVVGASMGGMIAQHLAARHPGRVSTLTTIMSSSGARRLPAARQDVEHLMASPSPRCDPEQAIRRALRFWQMISSPEFPSDPVSLEAFVRACAARCPLGGANETRHLAAIIADGSRVGLLRRIQLPCLVIHGEEDPLLPLECGINIAHHLTNARLATIRGMGHDLPDQLVDRLSALLFNHFNNGNGARKQ